MLKLHPLDYRLDRRVRAHVLISELAQPLVPNLARSFGF